MKSLLVAFVLFLSITAFAQQPKPEAPPSPAAAAAANPDDVKSIDAIIHAVYDAISGTPGPRNWDRFRSLFHPQARLIPTGRRPMDERTGPRVLSVEDYVHSAGPFLEKNGFFENEIARKEERFGSIAQAFSTYESRHAKDEKPFQRGINSIQLYNDGSRWWVMNVMWDAETPEKPIPREYLK